jgi:amidase
MSDRFDGLDGLAQAELVHDGEVKPIELVEAAIARAEAVNPELNAIIHPRYERAREEAATAAGPLAGVPMVHKDLDGWTKGDPYHGGNARLKAQGFVADHDSYLAARFRDAGLVIIGRTNAPEFGLLPTTEPEAYGPSRNPWDLDRSTGGSSGGSAAAVAAGIVPIGHAGDGGGSIRIPASECGLVGLFPSRGRTSLGPAVDEAWGGFVRRHVVTRTVRDSAAVLDAVHGWLPGDPYTAPAPTRPFLDEVGADPGRLTIGVCTASASPYADLDPVCAAAADAVGQVLAGAGHEVSSTPWLLDESEQAAMSHHFATAYSAFGYREVLELEHLTGSPVTEADVEPTTWFIAEAGRAVSAGDLLEAMRQLSLLTRKMAAWWTPVAAGGGGHDLLITPTLMVPPPRLGWFSPEEGPLEALIRASTMTALTLPFNITGQPAISLPLHWDGGLPIGVQLVAAYGREDLLLRVAGQLEGLMPWGDRRPPVWA